MFLPLVWKCKLNYLDYFVVCESLIRTKWIEVLKVLENLNDIADELAYSYFWELKNHLHKSLFYSCSAFG